MRRLHLLILLALLSRIVFGQQEIEDVSPDGQARLDFSLPDQETEVGEQQVIEGVLVLRGQILTDKMEDLRRVAVSALMKICENKSVPVLAEIRQEIATYGDPKPEFLIEWWLLPPIGGGQYCVDSLAMMGYGASEPPFDPIIGPPPFRELLQMELRAYEGFFTLYIDNWKIFLGNHTCSYRKTISPIERAVTEYTTTVEPGVQKVEKEACRDGDPLMPPWVPPDKATEPPDMTSCTLALSACVCAAKPNCTWVENQGNGYWCQPKGHGNHTGGVACEHCPLQLECPLDPPALCALVLQPCACAFSGGCSWDLSQQTCVYGGDTLCRACSAQDFCTRPGVVAFEPAGLKYDYVVMGVDEAPWLVNLTFDRPMKFNRDLPHNPVQLHCRSILEHAYSIFSVKLDKLLLTKDYTVLQVDVSGTDNDRERECDLVILDNFVMDRDHVTFPGLPMQIFQLAIPDCTQPIFERFFPPNSEVGVTLNTTVTMFFSEAVTPLWTGVVTTVTLMALGGEWEGGKLGTDEVIAEIRLGGPRTTFDADQASLVIDFEGLIEPTVLYSFSVPAGALFDEAANHYDGLPMGIYQFRTVTEPVLIAYTEDEGDSQWQVHLGYAGLGLAGLGVAVVSWRAARLLCKGRKKVRADRIHCEPRPLRVSVPEPLSCKEGGTECFVPPRGPHRGSHGGQCPDSSPKSVHSQMAPYSPQCGSPVLLSPKSNLSRSQLSFGQLPVLSPKSQQSLRRTGSAHPDEQPAVAWQSTTLSSLTTTRSTTDFEMRPSGSPESTLGDAWPNPPGAQVAAALPQGGRESSPSRSPPRGSDPTSPTWCQTNGFVRGVAFAKQMPPPTRRPKSALW